MSRLYFEAEHDDGTPSTYGGSMRGGRASFHLILGDPTRPTTSPSVTDLQYVVPDFVGMTFDTVGNGGMRRTPPAAHPHLNNYYGVDVMPIQGRGTPLNTASLDTSASQPVPKFGLYPSYDVVVQYSTLDYEVAKDAAIAVSSGNWFNFSGVARGYQYAQEWDRFAWWETRPIDEWAKAQLGGGMKFRKNGDPANSPPNRVPFDSLPDLYLRNQILVYHWYDVPIRYTTSSNSYLNKYIGCVNQNVWPEHPWSPGQLLYMGYSPKPHKQVVNFAETGETLPSRLVDLELHFVVTQRTITSVAPVPSNLNWVTGGHNLRPWYGDRGFHYATCTDYVNPAVDTDTTKWVPSFPSFPVEILMTDPDFGQGGAV